MAENETPVQEKPISELNIWDVPSGTPQQETPPVEAEAPVETPTQEPEPVKEPVKEEVKVEPVVTEKIVEVEKIIEKLPEFKDEYSKRIFDAIQEGKENELYDYLVRKNKDYEVMSDIDVVKEKLKNDNPTWTQKDIDAEVKFKFGTLPAKKNLDDIDRELNPEEYDRAVEFNDQIDHKELLLTREARDARIALNETKKTIEFPKIAQEAAPKANEPTQEEIDESNRIWESHVDQEMPKLSDFKFKVGNEEVSYKITDEDRTNQTEYMKGFSGEKVAKDLGWIDENGNENVLKIAEDMLFLKNKEKIIASTATQMKTSATKEVVADIKNIDLNTSGTSSPTPAQDIGALLWR